VDVVYCRNYLRSWIWKTCIVFYFKIIVRFQSTRLYNNAFTPIKI